MKMDLISLLAGFIGGVIITRLYFNKAINALKNGANKINNDINKL